MFNTTLSPPEKGTPLRQQLQAKLTEYFNRSRLIQPSGIFKGTAAAITGDRRTKILDGFYKQRILLEVLRTPNAVRMNEMQSTLSSAEGFDQKAFCEAWKVISSYLGDPEVAHINGTGLPDVNIRQTV